MTRHLVMNQKIALRSQRYHLHHTLLSINHLVIRGNYMAHIKKYEVGTVAVDGWAVTFGTASRGLGGAAARPGPSLLYQM